MGKAATFVMLLNQKALLNLPALTITELTDLGMLEKDGVSLFVSSYMQGAGKYVDSGYFANLSNLAAELS